MWLSDRFANSAPTAAETTSGAASVPCPLYPLPMYYLLLYDVVDDYLERRGMFREAHLNLARKAHERGDLVLAGALAEPADGAVLVFRADGPAVAERFAE